MKIRLFGSPTCETCWLIKSFLKTNNPLELELEYIDSWDDDNKDVCDENNVEELPHLQFIDKDITYDFVGGLEIWNFIKTISE